MKDKIEALKREVIFVETLIWHLEGNSSKRDFLTNGAISSEIDCYDNTGADIQRIIDSILEEHGDEILPTRD